MHQEAKDIDFKLAGPVVQLVHQDLNANLSLCRKAWKDNSIKISEPIIYEYDYKKHHSSDTTTSNLREILGHFSRLWLVDWGKDKKAEKEGIGEALARCTYHEGQGHETLSSHDYSRGCWPVKLRNTTEGHHCCSAPPALPPYQGRGRRLHWGNRYSDRIRQYCCLHASIFDIQCKMQCKEKEYDVIYCLDPFRSPVHRLPI